MAVLTAGKTAPDFTLLTDTGEPLKLSSLRGAPVVLFFYPQDNTPTCTTEACEFRDTMPEFNSVGATVLGISPDDVKSHVKFRKKFKLPYALLADTERKVCEKYGVWGPKKLFGISYMGVIRTTFVIDKRGKIAAVFNVTRAKGHAEAVAAAVQALK